MKKILLLISALCGFFIVAPVVSAHEAYVLPGDYFWKNLDGPASFRALNALRDQHNVLIFSEIAGAVFLLLVLNFFFRRSAPGRRFHEWLERPAFMGPIVIRLAIGAAFFYSALSWSFLGPELPLQTFPWAGLMRISLFAASGMILAGFLTELAALFALILFTFGFFFFGAYLMTYLNYLGELVVLLLFGMRRWSFDVWMFGPLGRLRRWERYAPVMVRVSYGVALVFAAITVKFLHPDLTVSVVSNWHLAQFHWLFPSDPLLITLGGGLAELVIGLLIIFGFEMRLTVFISLIYITLSLLYFRESVWPHFLLYGISINLLIQPETFTLDRALFGGKSG